MSETMYSKKHFWIKIEDGTAIFGLSDYAQKMLKEIMFVDLPKVGDVSNIDEKVGSIESAKSVTDIIAPLSGEIIAVNTLLEDSPELINEKPDETWIAKIKIKDDSQLASLMTKQDYEKKNTA
jgi:glycine cleavage system H protein